MKFVLAKKISNGVPVALIYWKRSGGVGYVVAWNCPFENIKDDDVFGDWIPVFEGSWGQGHYFSRLVDAVKYYNENYVED